MKTIRWVLRILPVATVGLVAAAVALLLFGRIERTVEARGEVQVEQYQILRPQVPGLVQEVLVDPGDTVREGQPILRLWDHKLEQELLTARRQLDEARSRLHKIRLERRVLAETIHPLEVERQAAEIEDTSIESAIRSSRVREAEIQLRAARERSGKMRELSDLGLISEQQLEETLQEELAAEQLLEQRRLEAERAERLRPTLERDLRLLQGEQRQRVETLAAEISELEARTEQWRGQVEQLEGLQERFLLRASLDGVVVGSKDQDLIGRYVQAGEDLLTIIDPHSIYFVTRVPEQALVRVRNGQPVQVEIAGLPKRHFDLFRGQVRKVSQEPVTQPSSAGPVYPVQIHLQSPWVSLTEGRFYLRSGMQGMAQIAYRRNVPIFDALYEMLVGPPTASPETPEAAEVVATDGGSHALP